MPPIRLRRALVALGVLTALTLCVPGASRSQESFAFPVAGDASATARVRAIHSRLTGEGLDAFVDGFEAPPGWADPRRAPGAGPGAHSGPFEIAAGPGWAPIPPPARWSHTMFYDPNRDRLIAFGGAGYSGATNELWAFELTGIPHWVKLLPNGTSPSARSYHAAVYDSVGDRMIVFGGNDGSSRNDVWQLSFSGNPTWTQLSPSGTPPSARDWHSAVVDRVRNRMLVFGGYANGAGRNNEVWALSLTGAPAWTKLNPTGTPPQPRDSHTAVYDPVLDRMVIFGGVATGGARNDVWSLSLAGTPAWTLLTPTGTPPSARFGASALFDRQRRRMYLFGGGVGAPNTSETWVLDLSGGTPAWTQLTPTNPPQGRQYHRAAYDPLGDRMLVFGGSSGPILGDTWALPLSPGTNWIPLSGTRRKGHSALFDPARHRMVVFGGENGTQLNDAWELGLEETPTWARLYPGETPPSPRALHSTIYEPKRDRMIIFGGRGGPPVNDVWELAFSGTLAWHQIVPTGTPPAPRLDHAAVYDPQRHRMLVFGGADAGGMYNDVWALSLSGTPAWTLLAPTGTRPAGRAAAHVVYDSVRDRLIVHGGYDRNFFALSDVWALSLAGAGAWTPLSPTGLAPPASFAGAAIFDPGRERMVISGGTDFDMYFADTWALQLGISTPSWSKLSLPGAAPAPRSDHKAVYESSGDRMVFFGGVNPTGILHDAWELQFVTPVGVEDGAPLSARLAVEPAWPNPSRGSTQLALTLPSAGIVELVVFDATGRKVRTLARGPYGGGRHTFVWDGADDAGARVPAGIYLYRVKSGGESTGGKVVRLP
ncbi:MAG: Kelch repeat-containing protein [Candidatus Eiseniibacteriota bacterium]